MNAKRTMLSRRHFLKFAGVAAGTFALDRKLVAAAMPENTNAPYPNKSLHALTDATCLLSASEMVTRIRAGKLSPVDLVEMHIERIKAIEPIVNAITYLDEEEARQRAGVAAEMIKHNQVDWSQQPLFGVPFSVKNSLDVEGIQVACGCPLLKYNIAKEDAFVVARMKRAGANFLSATNLPFFSMITETDSGLHGITKNPYNLNRTPGGSSGGEAALIAIGCSPVGIGTDGGGSIRFPSVWCGLAGLCVTPRRMSHRGHFTAFGWKRVGEDEPAFMSIGPIARRVEDLERVLPVIAVPDPERQVTHGLEPIGQLWPVPPREIRVVYFTKWSDGRGEPTREVQDAIQAAADALARRGCKVQQTYPAFFDETIDIGDAFCLKGLDGETLRQVSDQYGGQGNEAFDRMISWWNDLEERLGHEAETWRGRYPAWRKQYLEFMSGIDVMLAPVYPMPAPKHGEAFVSKEAGDDSTYAYLVNNVDVIPAGTLRITDSKEPETKGLPIGIQVVGSPFGERKVLRIMKELEDIFGGYQPPHEFPDRPAS
jgi:amidase